ncbi:siderophore-interacting protein [Agromyces sp. LHK192]|uniref:siderophore-interacting protein n=1 Tax=Agromyces sp. LHK192 TaxID=2498704 RepID=UPI000FD9D341|nr:siderophore-interacting protein [Agromyces sp. LHK192]
MAKSHSEPLKPERTVPLHLEVLRRERISPSFVRVTVGGGQVDRFAFRGADQWFRLFLPPAGTELRLPDRDGWGGYARLLAMPRAIRPVMRNYTVRAFRPAGAPGATSGAELDIDFVLHENAAGDLEGIAATWAATCEPGDALGLLDEGVGFDASISARRFLIAGDETALPAVAGVCESLPSDASGVAFIEVPDAADVQEFAHPAGVEVRWLVRGHDDRPGSLAYRAATEVAIDRPGEWAGYAAGEQALAAGIRRLLVAKGVDKQAISFCGYWRLPKDAPAIDAPVDVAA